MKLSDTTLAGRWLALSALAAAVGLWGFGPWDRAPSDAFAQPPAAMRSPGSSGVSSNNLLVMPLASEAGGAYPLVVVDTASRVMGVYHVDRATGQLSLKSVRNVEWDLKLEEFNSTVPTPREIRSLVERR